MARLEKKEPLCERLSVQYQLRVHPAISEVDATAWNHLTGTDDPFVEHAFLHALEASGSATGVTGWAPCHLTAWHGEALVGAVPAYLKSHSYGEYIFDWGWANAARRSGIEYYPKIVAAVPFTPAGVSRLLVAPDAGDEAAAIRQTLAQGLRALAGRLEASSVHVLFCSELDRAALVDAGFLGRSTFQFHFENRHPETDLPYRDFGDFEGAFRAPDRRKLRRERREARTVGLELVRRTGAELTDVEWAALRRFYEATTEEKGAIPYLTEDFFRRLRTDFGHRVQATLALDGGKPVAGALAFTKGRHLYGRYWGAEGRVEMLHFEVCYYMSIEWVIDGEMTRFEAGAQGEHKLKRGLLPAETRSAHFIADPRLRAAIARAVAQESAQTAQLMTEYTAAGPFRRKAGAASTVEPRDDETDP